MFCQVNKCYHPLTRHRTRSYTQSDKVKNYKQRVAGVTIQSSVAAKFEKGRQFTLDNNKHYNEIVIDGKVARIELIPNCLNLKITLPVSSRRRFSKPIRMLSNSQLNKSILKQSAENGSNTSKSVSFNNTYYISAIPARPQHQQDTKPGTLKNYESMYKEYLKSVQIKAVPPPDPSTLASGTMNGSAASSQQSISIVSAMSQVEDDEDDMEVEMLDEDMPKRKRGRPKGSGRGPRPAPRKRGWPLGVPRKPHLHAGYVKKPPAPVVPPRILATAGTPSPKGKRGRPRKIIAFGFQTIVSDIKTVALPSDLWSAHVSVTAKKSQVCFTRVVQAISNTVPVECDRSVKFNGSVNYLVRINNRDVELLAAPPTVTSIRDVEILLDIVNDIGLNDPVLEYLNR